MAQFIKGSIAYQPVVEQINRKFALKKTKCSAPLPSDKLPVKIIPNSFMGGATRNSSRGFYGACKKNYMFMRENARTTPPSVKEMDLRNNFAQVVAGRQHILEDLTQVTLVQALWIGGKVGNVTYEGAYNNPSLLINGVSAKGYTYRGWIFAVQYAGLKADEEYDVNHFPTAYDA